MQRLVTVGLLLMLVLALAVSTGCTNVQKGAAAGGVLGAAIGGPWAHNSGTISTCGGVAIGAATGGLLGALLGDAYDEMKTKEQIAALNDKIAALENELAEKDKLIAQLRKEIADLKNRPTGPAIEKFVLSNDILFATGKANLRPEGKDLIDKVTAYVKQNYADKQVVIEGHTDNQPIKYSGWKSNWELGAARALAVLHRMTNEGAIAGAKISAQTFGEFAPVADNGTAAGRQKNRRSVITVMDQIKSVDKSVK